MTISVRSSSSGGLSILIDGKNTLQTDTRLLDNTTSNLAGSFSPGFNRLVTSTQSTGDSVSIASQTIDFTTGTHSPSHPLTLAFNTSNGFLVVSKNGTSSPNQLLYERLGDFQATNDGNFLVDSQGHFLLAFPFKPDGTLDRTNIVPVNISGETDLGFLNNGILVNNFSAFNDALASSTELPERKPLYQVAVTDFPSRSNLRQSPSGNSYLQTSASGPPRAFGLGGEDYSFINPENTESSNVEYLAEIVNSIILQRKFNADIGIHTLTSNLLKDTIQKLGQA